MNTGKGGCNGSMNKPQEIREKESGSSGRRLSAAEALEGGRGEHRRAKRKRFAQPQTKPTHARALGLSRQMALINANPDGWRDLPFDKLTHHQALALAGLIANHRGEIQKGLINTGDKFPGCTCLATEGSNRSTLLHRALYCPQWQDRPPVTELTNLIGRHADSPLRLKQALSGELGAPRQRTALHCLGKLVFGSTPP